MTRRVRVCMLTTSFPRFQGDKAGIFVWELAQALTARAVQVSVIAPHDLKAKGSEIRNGINIERFRYALPAGAQRLAYHQGMAENLQRSWLARLQVLPFVLAFLSKAAPIVSRCDIIHAHWILPGMIGVLLGRLFHKPVVLMMYGAEVFVLGENPLLKFIIRNADHVVGISRYTLQQTIAVQRPKAHSLIPPGVDVHRFQPREDTTEVEHKLARQGIDLSQPSVFALGNFIERKGFSYLIKAIALLQKRGPAQLMMGGRGPLKGALQRQAADLGIADCVTFLDYIPDEELPAYYTIADLFVSPSIVDSRGDTEGLGMVLLEALACETPCVGSAVGGILDIIQDGDNGFLVEPRDSAAIADKVWQLISDSKLRQEMGKQGRLFVERHFSWQAKAREILQVYRTVLGGKR